MELFDSLVWELVVCQGCVMVRVSLECIIIYIVIGLMSEGCIVMVRIVVEVNNVEWIYVFMAFLLNNDGINDVFWLYVGLEFVWGVSFCVFNCWGSLVYEVSDFWFFVSQIGWDGQYIGELVLLGVYGYYLVVERGNGVVVEWLGEVNLIRQLLN